MNFFKDGKKSIISTREKVEVENLKFSLKITKRLKT